MFYSLIVCVYINTCPTQPTRQASTPYTGKYFPLCTVQRCPEASDRTCIYEIWTGPGKTRNTKTVLTARVCEQSSGVGSVKFHYYFRKIGRSMKNMQDQNRVDYLCLYQPTYSRILVDGSTGNRSHPAIKLGFAESTIHLCQ